MSGVSRIATRTLASASPLSRMALRQPLIRRQAFSLQSFKESVFERTAVAKDAAPADWGRQVRHVGDVAKFYFPFYTVFIGWVFGAEALCDGHL